MREWRRYGPLGVLLGIVNYIKTPQQYEAFANCQRTAYRELPNTDKLVILQPVKPVVTRWNSYYDCFERAVQLQPAINAYASSHIENIRKEDAYADSRNNKRPEAPR